jgi:hypothetical protein
MPFEGPVLPRPGLQDGLNRSDPGPGTPSPRFWASWGLGAVGIRFIGSSAF